MTRPTTTEKYWKQFVEDAIFPGEVLKNVLSVMLRSISIFYEVITGAGYGWPTNGGNNNDGKSGLCKILKKKTWCGCPMGWFYSRIQFLFYWKVSWKESRRRLDIRGKYQGGSCNAKPFGEWYDGIRDQQQKAIPDFWQLRHLKEFEMNMHMSMKNAWW